MFRVFAYIFSLSVCVLGAWGQSLSDNASYRALSAEQKELKTREDSLAASLEQSRKLFEQGSTKASSDKIVQLESEIYDLRARISRISSKLSAIEQEFASQALQESATDRVERRGFFTNDIFSTNLSRKDLSMLSSSKKTESTVLELSNAVSALYAKLKSLKVAYEQTSSQSELDKVRAEAQQIKGQIVAVDQKMTADWNKLYNFKLDTYLVLIDKLKNVDRSALETLETEGREVRRAEAFASELLNSNFVVFEAQRSYVRSYEKIIARSEGLKMALDSLSRLKPILTSVDSVVDLSFDPRILTIYAPVSFQKENYPIASINDVPETIIPETGIYYSVQIALMNAAPKSLDMFKGAWPLQIEHTSDGKFRYMVGGFSTYAEASAAVTKLYKAGYKAPVMVAWVDGKFTSTAKAKAVEATKPKVEGTSGSFKIEVQTTDTAVADKLRAVTEMHAKGKSTARLVKGKNLIFTITEFGDRYEAEVIAQIIRERTGASADVVKIGNVAP